MTAKDGLSIKSPAVNKSRYIMYKRTNIAKRSTTGLVTECKHGIMCKYVADKIYAFLREPYIPISYSTCNN